MAEPSSTVASSGPQTPASGRYDRDEQVLPAPGEREGYDPAGGTADPRPVNNRPSEHTACDKTKESRLSPAPHVYENVGEEYGSLDQGGSYDVLRCRVCGRVAYSQMAD